MNKYEAIRTCNISKFSVISGLLNDLSVTVSQGENFRVHWEETAPVKTTFMRIICGLMKPSSGDIGKSRRMQLSFLKNVRVS